MDTLFQQHAGSKDDIAGYTFYRVQYFGDDILTTRGRDNYVWVNVDSVCRALGFTEAATLMRIDALEEDPGMIESLMLMRVKPPDDVSGDGETNLLFINLNCLNEWLFDILAEYKSYPEEAINRKFLDKLELYTYHLDGNIAKHYCVEVVSKEVLNGRHQTEYEDWMQVMARQYLMYEFEIRDECREYEQFLSRIEADPDAVHIGNPSVIANELVKLYSDYMCGGDYAYAWNVARSRLWCYNDVCIDLCKANDMVAVCMEDDGDWPTILCSLAMMCSDAGIKDEKIGLVIMRSDVQYDADLSFFSSDGCSGYCDCCEFGEDDDCDCPFCDGEDGT